jgi:hypothetical protein
MSMGGFSTAPDDGAIRNLLPIPPGTYYVEAEAFADATFFGIAVADYVCTANC